MEEINQELKEFERFLGVIRKLRAPDGCPWDREQTHESLRNNLVEEAYEVAEAVDNADAENICEELGDVLMVAGLQTAIGEENGEFDMAKVLKGISDKMIYRHPHVFGRDVDGNITTSQVLENWEELKAKEKKENTLEDSLNRIAKALPANVRAAKVQKKAAKVGMDFESYDQALSKVYEELKELEQARNIGDQSHIEEEFGDLLFSIVNISRFLGINAENALTNAIDKFINRIVGVERLATEKGMRLTEMSPQELDGLWTEVKILGGC